MNRCVLYAIVVVLILQLVFLLFPPAAEAHIGAGIVVDRAARVYFLDTLRGRVWMVDAAGRVKAIAEHKHGDALVLGPDGNIYCEDVITGRIWRITPEGAATEVLPKSKRTAAVGWDYLLTVGADGSFYFVSGYPDQVHLLKMDASGEGKFIAGSTRGTADGPAREAQFREVHAADWGADGALYVVDGNRIRKLSADGMVTTVAGSAEGGFADGAGIAARFQQPTSLSLDAQGNIFVADFGNRRVRKISPTGEVCTVTGVGDSWTPIGIAGVAAAGGDLYVLERFGLYNNPSIFFTWFGDIAGNPRVRRISASGDAITVANIRGLTGLGITTGLLTLGAALVLSAIVWFVRRLLRRRARRLLMRGAVAV
jgi:sugar lactone lactonase YvrE